MTTTRQRFAIGGVLAGLASIATVVSVGLQVADRTDPPAPPGTLPVSSPSPQQPGGTPAPTAGPEVTPTATPSPVPSPTDDPGVDPLAQFPVHEIDMGGDRYRVAVASTPRQVTQGLRGVDDLGELDGMLFSFAAPVAYTVDMRDVGLSLDLVYFGIDGRSIGWLRAEPCTAEPCPVYDLSLLYGYPVAYQWVLCLPSGTVADVPYGTPLQVLS